MSHLLFQGRFLTTRHRWLNRFILAELEVVKRFPRLKSVEKPIFIIGTGRSGSTILGKVLSIHRDVGFLNEPKALWYSIDAREDVNGHFNRGPARFRFSERDATPHKRRVVHRLFGFYLALTGSRRVLDKNPEIIFRTPFVRTIFPDARFVFLVRNGWDTVHSIAAWSRRNRKQVGGEAQDWWGADQRKWQLMVAQLVSTEPLFSQCQGTIRSFSRREDMAAVEWIVTMQEGLRLMQSMPDRIHKVCYEEMTQQPETILERLREFCELPEDAVFLSYAQRVLSPNPSKKPFALPPAIEAAFHETMAALDYPIGNPL